MLDAAQIKDLQSLVDPPAVTLLLHNDLPDRAGRLDALFGEVGPDRVVDARAPGVV